MLRACAHLVAGLHAQGCRVARIWLQASEEKEEELRLAREAASDPDPDAADFMSSATGARPASQQSQRPSQPPQPQRPQQPQRPSQPRVAPQYAAAPQPAADAYGGDDDSNPMRCIQAATFCTQAATFCTQAASLCTQAAALYTQAATLCTQAATLCAQAATLCVQVASTTTTGSRVSR